MIRLLLQCMLWTFQLIATGTDTNNRVYYVSDFSKLGEVVNFIETDVRSFVIEGNCCVLYILTHNH